MIKGWPTFKEWLRITESPYDPQTPLAAHEAWARGQLAKGNKVAMLYMLDRCLRKKEPVPGWLAKELLSAIHKVATLEATSWDEVFGRPLEKGQRAGVIRRNRKMSDEICAQVSFRHRAGEAIDNEMFSRIGTQLNMSGSVVRQIYYESRERWDFFADPEELEEQFKEFQKNSK
jgi:hypothetical protein